MWIVFSVTFLFFAGFLRVEGDEIKPLNNPLAPVGNSELDETRPVDLKFTAADGREVDLKKLRGKIVLLYFWSSTDRLSAREAPDVLEAYQKFHDKGVEVVGVSLDRDPAAMMTFAKANGLPWPEYCDGKAWDGGIVKELGVGFVPSRWLIGRDGKVVWISFWEDAQMHVHIADEVEKLLGESTAESRVRSIRYQLARMELVASREWWNLVAAQIDDYGTEFAAAPETTRNVIALRKLQFQTGKKLADQQWRVARHLPERDLRLAQRTHDDQNAGFIQGQMDAQSKVADPFARPDFQAVLQKLTADPIPEVAALAADQLALQKQMVELESTPLDLKFTAVDGREVDLAQLRGKVVLLDFWATWCGPCRAELPQVLDAYRKFHPTGFEIIGISFDEKADKAKLTAFTQAQEMPWPQYFDGEGWDNALGKKWNIRSIPTMWLVDKKGMLETTNAREDVGGQVEELLANP